MKSKRRKRVIAIVLCMVLMLSTGITTIAEAEPSGTEQQTAQETKTAESQGAAEETKVQAEAEPEKETQTQKPEQPAPEPTADVQTEAEKTQAQDSAESETTDTATTQTESAATEQKTETVTEPETETASQTQTAESEEKPTGVENGTQTQNVEEEEAEEDQKAETPDEQKTSPAFQDTYENAEVTVEVSANEGVIPEGAELSVTPIKKREITSQMSAEEKAEATKINAQYELTEKKLKENSEENEETMEGFLAYDISFLVDGKEVEPNGDVKVTMDFKKSVVPDGVSEDAEVSVKHLKEEKTAEDGVVVEDVTEKATVKTTEKAEVEKIELTADRFSIYTLQWGTNSRASLNVNVVTTDGNNIGDNKTIILENGDAQSVSSIAGKFGLSGGYKFIGAYLDSWQQDKDNQIQRLRRNSGENQYSKDSKGTRNWEDVGSSDIYFVFESILPGTVETADTSGFIELSLFDYVVGSKNTDPPYDEYNQEENHRPGDSTGINKDHALKFQTNSKGWGDDSINKSGTNGQPNTGIVLSKLGKDGFPVLNSAKENSNGESLSYLFNSVSQSYKSVHTGLNRLFQYNNATRQYYYNSDKNYAYLDVKNNATDFVVYDTFASIKNDDKTTRGFFPFSKYEAVNGSQRGYKNGVSLDCNDRQNHYFGMSMSTRFMQPKNGMITADDKMVFSFSGDDDVWVFIDGVLVMDIGGSHAAIAGTIDFTTGEVVVAGKRQGYIGDLLRENGVSESKLKFGKTENGAKVATLKDYEEFDLDFFYLERGNWDSNCKLEFNLAMINKNSVSVGKEITDVDTSKYGDIEFEYLIKVGESKSSLSPYTNRKYKIYNLDTRTYTGMTGTTDSEGKFKLKHNQLAVFEEDKTAGTEGINENLYYQVTELNVNSQQYNNVIVNQTDIVSTNYDETINKDGSITGNESNEIYNAASPEYQVGETSLVIFYNRCSAYNKRELHITKEMQPGQTSNDTFELQVTLGGKLYKGKYFLIANEETKQMTATDGKIELRVGEKAVISEIPADTTFEVLEKTDTLTDYRAPLYKVENGGDSAGTDEKATGTIVSGKDTYVTVVNGYKSVTDTTFIKVQKTFVGVEDPEKQFPDFEIVVSKDKSQSDIIGTLTLESSSYEERTENEDGSITYVWEIYNLEGGTYWIKENGGELEAFTVDTTVNGTEVNMDTVTSVTTKTPTFEFSRVEEKKDCSNTILGFQANVVAARLTTSGYFVWTEMPLSGEERKAIINMCVNKPNNNWSDMSVNNTDFYSGYEAEDEGYSTGKGTIWVKRNEDVTSLEFSGKSVWTHSLIGIYERTAGQNAEIEITNTYTENLVTIDLQKYGSDYTQQREGAKFSLFKGTYDESTEKYTYLTPVEGYSNILVTSTNKEELKLPSGYYKLSETEAPTGFQRLEEDIYFKVESGSVSLIDGMTGKVISDSQNMWQLDKENITIKIKNIALFSLPSSGGPGIFWYTISGILLLMAGSLILYKLKNGEVLGK